MDNSLIERLAREASPDGWQTLMEEGHGEAMRRFAAVVAEECAKRVDSIPRNANVRDLEDAARAIREKFKEP